MTHQPSPDAVVVGGGVIGLGIAWRAALAGMAVTVVDQAPGRGASWAAAGMLAPVTEVHYGERPLLGLNLAAAARWPAFAAEVEEASGLPVGYRPGGTLAVARDADDNAALRGPLPVPAPLRPGGRAPPQPRVPPARAAASPRASAAACWPPATTRSTTAPLVEALLAACQRAGVRHGDGPGRRAGGRRVTGCHRRCVLGDGETARRRGGGAGRRVLERGARRAGRSRRCRRCGR